MNRQFFILLFAISSFFICSHDLEAAKRKMFASEEEADCYCKTHHYLGCKYYQAKDWRSASNEFEKVIYFFPDSDLASEAAFYLGVCYYELREYDFANAEFSRYLKTAQRPLFFSEAVYYKFNSAEHLKMGKKRRPFNVRYFPKWIYGQDLALTIYDEVVAALPNSELAIMALYSKAELLSSLREYRLSVEAYQTIIKKFPKSQIVPCCYENIAKAYVEQSRLEFQNPDILALAELNAERFANEFPRDKRVKFIRDTVLSIKECYANGLYSLGAFYERIKKPAAAIIYYQSSIEEFPETKVAELCRLRLVELGHVFDEECFSPSNQKTEDAPFPEVDCEEGV